MAQPSMRNRKLFWLSYLATTVWVILFLIINNQADMDLWGVMSFGALLDQNTGRFPYIDPFSYTAKGVPWIYHEWGSGVVFYQFFKYGGSQALFWLKLLLVEVMLVLSCHLYLLGGLRRRPQPPSRLSQAVYALCLPFVVYLLMPDVDTTIRCQLFTFAGFAFFLYLLKRHSQGRLVYGIWLIPLYMLVWANLHGGFIMGLGLLGIYLIYHWFSDRNRQTESLAVVLFLSTLATMANPYGLQFWQTMISAWTLPRTHISEWGNILSLGIPFYGFIYTALYLLGLLLGFLQWRRTRELFPVSLVLLLFTGAYGWLHYKLAPLYLLTFLSIGMDSLDEDLGLLASWLPLTLNRYKQAVTQVFPALTLWFVTGLLVLGLFLGGFYWRGHPDLWSVKIPTLPASASKPIREGSMTTFYYPVGVTGYLLRHHVHGNLWVPFAWGEFLYWVLYPQCRISIDGRYETVYSERIFNDFYRFYHPPYPLALAERYPTTHILVDIAHPTLIQKLRMSRKWFEVYQDNESVLFSRHREPLEVQKVPHKPLTLDNYRGDLSRFTSIVGI